jgi:putative nucleotidyltransferase with HDIG domain
MTTVPTGAPAAPKPLTRAQVEHRLKDCARLPSLSTINNALRDLLAADQRYTAQIAEIIRRDPSLTARLLRLVNSVYYGLSAPVNSIEEAVLYLGVRQIRQLVMVTPVIEDFTRLAGGAAFPWRDFWQHCISTAILTREVIGAQQTPADEVDYVSGLIHDVGKIAMAAAFPEHFEAVYRHPEIATLDLRQVETSTLGMDHAELGALYLRNHHLPEVLVEVARCHHQPERAAHHAPMVAAVHIADMLTRHAGIGNSGNGAAVSEEDWLHTPAWDILYPQKDAAEKAIARANLKRSLERLPMILEGMV